MVVAAEDAVFDSGAGNSKHQGGVFGEKYSGADVNPAMPMLDSSITS